MVIEAHKKALQRLWIGKATIFNQEETKDPITGIVSFEKVTIAEDEPCRVSYPFPNDVYVNESATIQNLNAPVTLFIRPDLIIKEGSYITVTQHNRTTEYRASGTPSVFTNHQEIRLKLVKDYA